MSRRLTEAEVSRRIADRHGAWVEPVRYDGKVSTRSDFRCRRCEWKWTTAAIHVYRGDGCANCGGSRQLTEAEIRERVTARHDGKVQLVHYCGKVLTPSKFRCRVCDHTWSTHASNVYNNGKGCPLSAGNTPVVEAIVQKRIASQHGDGIAMLYYCGSSRGQSQFRCSTCGHEWWTAATHVMGGSGCRPCARIRRADEARLPLADVVERLAEVHKGRITLIHCGGTFLAASDFRCAQGHEWSSTVGNVVSGGNGCARCSGRALLSEAEVRQRIEDRTEGRVALLRYGGRMRHGFPAEFLCRVCGHEWTTNPNNVMTGSGCPVCARYGFDTDAPARLYRLYNLDMRAAKVGVTTAENDRRLDKYRRAGWRTYRLQHFATGAEAVAEEQRILAEWRAAGFPEAVTADDMPMGGWTETAPLSALPGWELLLEDAAS